MKKLKCLVCTVLAFAMCAGMVVLPVAASAVPDGVTTVDELLATFGEANYSVYDLGDGSITYDGNDCLKMVKNPGTVTATNDTSDRGPRKDYTYRLDINPDEDDYKSESNLAYCVINYASCSSAAHELFIWCPKLQGAAATDSRVVTIAEVGAGDTGWTCSSVITITAGLKERIKGTNSFTVASTKANSDVYIRSIVFFANEEDAAKYAELAPFIMNPDAEAKAERLEKREKNWETIKLIMMLIGTSIGERMDSKLNLVYPFDNIDSNLYSVVSFTEDNIVVGSGTAKATVDNYNGEDCAKMVEQEWSMSNFFEYGDGGHTTYRNVSIKPAKNEYDATDLKYCVVNYASVSDQKHTLWFWAPNLHGQNKARGLKIDEVPAGFTDWQNSPVIEVPEGMKTRLTQPNNVILASDAQKGSTVVYISSIIFFETKDAAEQYLKQYDEFYGKDRSDVIAGDPLKELKTSAKGAVLPMVFDGDEYILTGDGSNSVVTAGYSYGERNVGGVKLNYKASAMNMDTLGGNFSLAVASGGNNVCNDFRSSFTAEDYKYAVITYATDTTASAELGVFRWGKTAAAPNTDAKPRHTVVDNDISASKGKWVNTGVVEIGPAWDHRITTQGKIYIYSPLTDNDASLYIREIVYFTNADDAKYYADNAPKYYNESYGYFVNPAEALQTSSKGSVLPMVFDGDKYTNVNDAGASKVTPNSSYGERGVISVALSYEENVMTMDQLGGNYSMALDNNPSDADKSYKAFCTEFGKEDYNYAVITYATDTAESAYLGVFRWGNTATGRHTVVANDISVSEGEWVTTGVVEIGTDWKNRVKQPGKLYVFSPLADEEASVYIREIVYFTNADDAKYYADNAPEYYNVKYGYFN